MKMKDSGVEWIGEIPEGWEVVATKRKFKNSKEIVGNRVSEYERLSLTLNGVLKRQIDDDKGLQPENFSTYQVIYKDELVFKLIDLENVKTSRVGYSPYTGIISPVYIRLSNKNESRFGYYYFINMWHQEVFNYLGSGVRSNLNANDLLNIPYLSIPQKEQQKIADFLDSKIALIDQIIADTKRSIEELKSYKQSLITETVTKGLDPNVPMKDSGVEWIGKIPEGWENMPLRYLGQLQNGISKGGDFFGSGYPFVNYGDVYKNDIVEASGLIQSTATEQENYSVKRGDVFFTRTSETIDEVGISSVALEDIGNATFAGFLIRFRPSTNKLLPEYSKYYFTSFNVRQHFTGMMNMVIRASLGQELLKSLPVFIPTKTEQKRIVNFLDEKLKNIQEQIQYKINIISEYESYKKSLIYEYVTGKKQVK
ncbi:restriction endonuclease subunit S [Lactococcus lactis]|uniref:restriction endonuclease subunit S n=1 Tax=Lactococcus lactis TaxID=1358 RepID=UPI00202695BD|nr:restriction endonuclease subunit S [Lactococcus lactis]MCL9638849.1 restriction endonuclease subunit S [Lactococcus lactis]